jgi:ABC-type antimicrobial peptide transport system permease subunit
VLAVVGVTVGLAGSFGLTRVISTLLFDVAATDKTTFAAVAIGLFAITFLASYIPAWRATKVDPLTALRYE